MAKSNKLYIGLIIGVLLVLTILGIALYFSYIEDKATRVSLQAYYFDNNGNLVPLDGEEAGQTFSVVTFQGRSPEVRNSIALEATIQAGSGANQATLYITEITAQNSPGTNVYQIALNNMVNPYTYPLVLNPGATDGGGQTRVSGVIDVTQIELGDVGFTFRVRGYYYNAKGQQIPLDITSEPYTINIRKEENTAFRTNNLNYGAGSEIAYDSSCGGSMQRYSYLGTGGSSSTSCSTYLTNVFIPSIPCNKPSGCSFGERNGEYTICWVDGTVKTVRYTLGGSSVSIDSLFLMRPEEVACTTVPQCVTGNWQNDICGGGTCGANLMHQTRTATPEGCNPNIEQCIADPTCEAPIGPTCSDGIKNQDETDIDCGGSVCSACADNLACNVNNDCISQICANNICEPEETNQNPNAGKTVVWRTSVLTCTSTAWISGNKWAAFDSDNNPTTPLVGYGDTTQYQSTNKNTDSYPWFTLLGGTSPCGYSLMSYIDTINAINVGGTTNDARFKNSLFGSGGGISSGPSSHLVTEPCCGYACGICCERYSDGTSNC